MELNQKTPEEIIARLNELDKIIKADTTKLPESVQATAAAEKEQAQSEILLLRNRYLYLMPNSTEIILMSGEGAEKAASTIESMGGIAVNAQELFDKVAEQVKELDGPQINGLVGINAYAVLAREIRGLLSTIGVVLEDGFNYSEGDQDKTLSQNLRLITNQAAGTAVEEAYILHAVASKSFERRQSEFPIPVAVYNIGTLNESNIGRVFKNKTMALFEKGSSSEVKRALSLIKKKMIEDGKLTEQNS